jgi:hypothetical protein
MKPFKRHQPTPDQLRKAQEAAARFRAENPVYLYLMRSKGQKRRQEKARRLAGLEAKPKPT